METLAASAEEISGMKEPTKDKWLVVKVLLWIAAGVLYLSLTTRWLPRELATCLLH